MVEVEVNPANVTVSKFPPHEDVLQLFTAEWPIAQKAAGTSQQNKEKEQETHKVAFCRVEITNRFSTLEHISQEAEIKETRVCPQHRGDSKWCKTQTQKIGKRRIRAIMPPPRSPQDPITVAIEVPKIKEYNILLYSLEYNQERGWMEQLSRMTPSLPIQLSQYQLAYIDLQMPKPESKVYGRPVRKTARRVVAGTGMKLNIVDVVTI